MDRGLAMDDVMLLLFILIMIAFGGILLLFIYFLHNMISFKNKLNHVINLMIKDEFKPADLIYNETFYSQTTRHLYQLYHVLQTTKKEVKSEKIELQELITDISHQIKTPMTTLKLAEAAMIQVINRPDELLDLIHTNSTHLNKLYFLLSSLITASRLETGTITLSPRLVNVGDTILIALENIIMAAAAKEISMSFEYTDTYYAYHDSKWTAEAIYNILDNAIKYSKAGDTVYVELSEIDIYVIISVSDTGIGISESEIPKIFQRFFRSETVKEVPGVGIGLYLSRDIITRQHGFINVSSTVDQGSTFTIYLPIQP